jgi:hypothetical protein
MVQLIPEYRKESFLDRLGTGLLNAGQSLGQTIPGYYEEQQQQQNAIQQPQQQMRQKQAMEQAFQQEIAQKEQQDFQRQQQMIKENEEAKRVGVDLSGITDPKKRQVAFIDALKGKKPQTSLGQKLKNETELPKKGKELKQEIAKPKSATEAKEQKEHAEMERVKETGQKSFNGIVKLLKKGNIGRGSNILSYFGGETARDTGEFQSLSGGLESMLVDMVSRGALSNSRFEYITQTLLPKPTDSQAEIEGKLSGLAQILGLDTSELEGGPKKSEKGNGKKSLEDIFG